jgi:hypothetical protein
MFSNAMERAELLAMVKRLGAEFRSRGMHAHLAPLRLYWLALHHDLVQQERHGLHVQLSEEMVVEWFKLFRLPPYERAYPVHPPGARCPRCPPGEGPAAEVVIERTFPEGRKVACVLCRTAWLELEPPTRIGRGSDASRKKPP